MKWYIHLAGERKGPLSGDEVLEMITAKKINADTLVWREGFPAWKKLSETPELTASSTPTAPQKTEGTPSQAFAYHDSSDISVFTELPKAAEEQTGTIGTLVLKEIKKEANTALKIEKTDIRSKRRTPLFVKWAIAAVIVGIGLGFAMFYLNPLEAKLPAISDISASDYDRLQAAYSASLEKQGGSVAIALSTEDVIHPQFYIVSNLPDSQQFDITIKQVPGTALEATTTPTMMHLNGLSQHMAKTSKLDLHPAEYTVTITTQGQAKPISITSRFFLGGVRDDSYKEALTRAKAGRQSRADAELQKMNQALAQLDGFQIMLQKLLELTQGKTSAPLAPSVIASVKNIEKQWDEIEKDLPHRSYVWQAEITEASVVYPQLLKLSRENWGQQKQAYETLQKYFAAPSPENIASVNEATNKAISSLIALKAEVGKTHSAEIQ